MRSRPGFPETIRGCGARGASLLEAIVTLSTMVIIMVGVYTVYDAGNAIYARGATDMLVQDDARKGQDEIAKLLRSAGNHPMGTGIFGFRSSGGFTPIATESSILYTMDANDDGALENNSSERVGFILVGRELRLSTDGVTAAPGLPPLARNVRTLRFSYFNAGNAPIPNPAGDTYTLTASQMRAIRRIAVQVTVDAQAGSQGPRVYTLSTDVRPRNL